MANMTVRGMDYVTRAYCSTRRCDDVRISSAVRGGDLECWCVCFNAQPLRIFGQKLFEYCGHKAIWPNSSSGPSDCAENIWQLELLNRSHQRLHIYVDKISRVKNYLSRLLSIIEPPDSI
jgi:hypothetical protein